MSRLSKIFFDPYLFFSIFLISFLGLFFLYSASNGDTSIVLKQFIFVVLGLILMLLVSQPDPDLFRRYALLFLIFSFLLLELLFYLDLKLMELRDGYESVLFQSSLQSFSNLRCQFFWLVSFIAKDYQFNQRK